MEPIFEKTFHIPATAVDCFDRLKPSQILDLLQDVAGDHCALLGTDRQALTKRNLFWAVLRHRVQITRLPRAGEDITLQTWPMPTTRTAYPRASAAFDADGNLLFRCVSLWVLMDSRERTMVLPGKSGVEVNGIAKGDELAVPGSMALKPLGQADRRTVRFTDLDWNGHMNNCRYLDWVADTLPASFHEEHSIKEFSVSYLSEAREGDGVTLHWELSEDGLLAIDGFREEGNLSTSRGRVFSARVLF